MKQVEYKVDTIGTNTLVGMLAKFVGPNEVKVDNVSEKHVIVHYFACLLSRDALAVELHSLYARGAEQVTLIEWEREKVHYKSDGTEIRIPARPIDPQWRS